MQLNSQFLFLFFVFLGHGAFAQTFYHTGSFQNVDSVPIPGIMLAGGATDNNNGMKWLLERANGGDVVVLRASGSDGYNNYLYSELGVDVNSVTTIRITSSTQANKDTVCNTVRNAEMIFLAGGDQWDYYSHWKGTCLQHALNDHVNVKNGPIGGTSAGLAVLGEVVYTAQNSSATSEQALANPFHSNVTLANDFLQIPFLENTVTDSHYNNPDRRGRHTTFMARMINDWQMDARGIGINEYTAVGVDENGLAHVFGNPTYNDYAYFIHSNSTPEKCEAGQPLHWLNNQQALNVYRVRGNTQGTNTFNLSNWQQGEGGEWFHWYVNNGQIGFVEAPYLHIHPIPVDRSGYDIRVFPNPARNQLQITLPESFTNSQIHLFDTTGRLLIKESLLQQNTTLNITALLPGVYIIQIINDNRPQTQWVIKY